MAAALVALVLDQISKCLVLFVLDLPSVGSVTLLPFLALTMVWNSGVSMGIPAGELFGGADAGRVGLVVVTVLISVYLWRWLRRAERVGEAIGTALVLGGAIGNVIDRILYGAVVDFIHLFGFGYHFYVFNIADSAITIGVMLLIADSLFPARLARMFGTPLPLETDAARNTESDAADASGRE